MANSDAPLADSFMHEMLINAFLIKMLRSRQTVQWGNVPDLTFTGAGTSREL